MHPATFENVGYIIVANAILGRLEALMLSEFELTRLNAIVGKARSLMKGTATTRNDEGGVVTTITNNAVLRWAGIAGTGTELCVRRLKNATRNVQT